jgi:hypothetical protein
MVLNGGILDIFVGVACGAAGALLGAIIGNIAHCMKCCQSCFCCREEQQNEKQQNEDTAAKFHTAFGWALQNYKQEIDNFELWNMISKTTIIVGSTIMYSRNRFFTHMIIMSWSLVLHIRFLPYKDRSSNIAAILFCLCDILGALSAGGQLSKQFPNKVGGGAAVEIIFIVCTLATIITVGVFIFRAIRTQAAALRNDGLSNSDTSNLFAMYTPLEKKLLFPVLAVVWVCVKLFRKLSTKGINDNEIALTKVVPEKDKEVKEQNEQNDEQNKTEEADDTIQQTNELAEIRGWD